MSPVGHESIRGSVVCAPVIPYGDVVLAPLEADVCLLGGGDQFVEVADDGVAFRPGDPDDLGDEPGVEEH